MRINHNLGPDLFLQNPDKKIGIPSVLWRLLALVTLCFLQLIPAPESAEARASFGAFVSVDAEPNGSCEVNYAQVGRGGKPVYGEQTVVGDGEARVQITNPNLLLDAIENDEWQKNLQPGTKVTVTPVGDSCVVSVSGKTGESAVVVSFADGGTAQPWLSDRDEEWPGVDNESVTVTMNGIQDGGEER